VHGIVSVHDDRGHLGEIIGMEHGPNSIGEPEEIETHGEMVSPCFQLQQTDADNNKNQIIESVKQVPMLPGYYVSERE
jgi:hypothetical protein